MGESLVLGMRLSIGVNTRCPDREYPPYDMTGSGDGPSHPHVLDVRGYCLRPLVWLSRIVFRLQGLWFQIKRAEQ